LEKYATGLPPQLEPAIYPLPFIYASTGKETKFHNQLEDPTMECVPWTECVAGETHKVLIALR